MSSNIDIILVDDHHLFRDGLKYVLSTIAGYEIYSEATNGNKFLEILSHHVPKIAIIDIAMPEMDGIEASRIAMERHPDLKIIVLSSYDDEGYYSKLAQIGVKGFLSKTIQKDELEFAIHSVLKGREYFSPEILKTLSSKTSSYPSKETALITEREKEVISLICKGLSNIEIGKELFISPKTVDKHRTSLLSKTQSANSANLVLNAIRLGLIEL